MDAAEQAARGGTAGLLKTAALSAAIVSGGVIAATSSDADPTGFGPDPDALSSGGAAVERDAPPAFRPDRDDPPAGWDAPAYGRPEAGAGHSSPVSSSPYAPYPAHDLYWTRPTVPTSPVSAWPVAGDWRDPYAGYAGAVTPVPPAVHDHGYPAGVGRPVGVPGSPYTHRHVHYDGVGRPAPLPPAFGRGGPTPGLGYGAGGVGLGTLVRLAGLGRGGNEHRHEDKHDPHEAKDSPGKKKGHEHKAREDDDD